MTQLEFPDLKNQVYEIDERLTMQEARKMLTRYRQFKQGAKGYDLKLTATYSIEPKSFSNEFSSQVEDNVIRKLDYLFMIEDAVNRMNVADERRVIIEGYMSKEKHNWVKMSQLLILNKTDYYILRNRALVNFAIALNKEEYKYPRVEGVE